MLASAGLRGDVEELGEEEVAVAGEGAVGDWGGGKGAVEGGEGAEGGEFACEHYGCVRGAGGFKKVGAGGGGLEGELAGGGEGGAAMWGEGVGG